MTQAPGVELFLAGIDSGQIFEDSAPYLRALRETAPVVQVPMQYGSSVWFATTWAACAALSRDSRLTSQRSERLRLFAPSELRQKMDPVVAIFREQVLTLDPPRHTVVRKLLNRAFTPETIERTIPWIEQLFARRLDEWIESGSGEIMERLVHPFPALVIARWLGLPASDWPLFLKWADAIVRFVAAVPLTAEEVEIGLERLRENQDYLTDFLEKQKPGEDNLVGLLLAMESEGVLDRYQLICQAFLILLAGHETTRNLIGSGLHLLLSHPDQNGEQLVKDDLALRLAVDEILRLASPVQMVGRYALEDFEFEGARIEKGEAVVLAWASANRDPHQFTDPDRLDLSRKNNPHLAFGAGIHACLGLHLARIEARIAFRALWTRLPNLKLAPQPIEWQRSLAIHGPRRLYVEYGASAKTTAGASGGAWKGVEWR
jgi:cytochrome P450